MTQVKICGITNKEDALVAAQCGAAALGFIFYPPSPRYIKPEDAKKIISTLPDKVIRVGVFVNEKPENIKRVMEYCALDMIQLHGDESPEYCRQFPASIVIKAVELKNEDDVNRALSYDVAAILVDSRQGDLYGGTGKKSNWELACRLSEQKTAYSFRRIKRGKYCRSYENSCSGGTGYQQRRGNITRHKRSRKTCTYI